MFRISELAFPPSAPCTFSCRRRLAWKCHFCVYEPLCGARVLCARLRPLSFSARITFDANIRGLDVDAIQMQVADTISCRSACAPLYTFVTCHARHAARAHDEAKTNHNQKNIILDVRGQRALGLLTTPIQSVVGGWSMNRRRRNYMWQTRA